MSRGEDLRRVTSLRSVAGKLVDFTLASFAETKAERVRYEFCTTRHDILFAIADRRPKSLDASVLEVAGDGELYLPELAWSSPAVKDDLPRAMRLRAEGERVAAPEPMGGLAAYCIWSNLSSNGEKGIAVCHDISDQTHDIEFLSQLPPDPYDDDEPWYSSTKISNMYLPGSARARGAAISAPIFVKSVNGPLTETRCVGALNITHRDPNYFSIADNYLWAQECATLIGLLYGLCRDRLVALDDFTHWKALNEAFKNGSPSRPSSRPPQKPWLDVELLVTDLMTLTPAMKRDEFARKLGVCYKTVQNLFNQKRCSLATAELLVGYISESKAVTLQRYLRDSEAK